MPSYNRVLLMGHLTRDVELKYTPANAAVAKIGLAINRRYKGKDDQMKDEVTFVDCEAWNQTAETISKFFSKGKPIFVEGRLKLDQWQDKDGTNRSKLKVVVETFQFVDSKGDNSEPSAQSTSRPATTRSNTPASQTHQPLGDDDIPF